MNFRFKWMISGLLTLCVMGGLVYWFQRSYTLDLTALTKIHPTWLLLGAAWALLDLLLRALRIMLVTWHVGHRLSFMTSIRVTMAVDFFAAITPARIGGEAARLVGFVQAGMTMQRSVIVCGIEALMDLGYLIAALPFFLLSTAGSESDLYATLRGVLIGLVLLLGVPSVVALTKESYAVAMVRSLERWLPTLMRLISGRGRWNLEAAFVDLRANLLESMRGPWWTFPLGVMMTGAWWVLRYCCLIWIGAVLGFKLGFAEMFWPQFIINHSLLWTPMPLSGGLFEASFVFVYKEMIPAALLPSTVVLWRFFTYYFFVLVGSVSTTRLMGRAIMARLNRAPGTDDMSDSGDASGGGDVSSSCPRSKPRQLPRRDDRQSQPASAAAGRASQTPRRPL